VDRSRGRHAGVGADTARKPALLLRATTDTSTLARPNNARVTFHGWLEDATNPLKGRAAEIGWRRTVERDLQRAMEQARAASAQTLALERWPGVGAVDLVDPQGLAVELKWAKSGATLCNSAWDVAKLGTALVEERIDDAWIAAGAPTAHWDAHAPGAELFEAAAYEGDALIRRYEAWWRFWCNDVATRPTQLPEGLRVSHTIVVPVTLDGEPFQLRAARVTVTDARWKRHVCPHVWRGETCPARS
jgi:hypothetical protein